MGDLLGTSLDSVVTFISKDIHFCFECGLITKPPRVSKKPCQLKPLRKPLCVAKIFLGKVLGGDFKPDDMLSIFLVMVWNVRALEGEAWMEDIFAVKLTLSKSVASCLIEETGSAFLAEMGGLNLWGFGVGMLTASSSMSSSSSLLMVLLEPSKMLPQSELL